MIKLFSLCVLLCLTLPAYAASLLAITSAANVPELVSGAHRFLKAQPSDQIIIRSTDQWKQLSRHEQASLLSNADIVFAAGVFGEPVARLQAALDAGEIRSFVALHSDRSLVLQSHIMGRRLLNNDADLDALMGHPSLDQSPMEWMTQHVAKHRNAQEWLQARLFWLGRDSYNMEGLFYHLSHLATQKQVDEATRFLPHLISPIRVVYQGETTDYRTFDMSVKPRWVVVMDYETGDRQGDKSVNEAMCTAIEQRDSSLGCLSLLASWGDASVAALEWLTEHDSSLAAIISLQSFVMGGSTGREQASQLLSQLNVPVIAALRLNDMSEQAWRLSEEGLPWDSVHYRVAMPELQGIGQSIIVAAKGAERVDQQTGAALAVITPIKGQIDILARRVERWSYLQQTANADKKIAIIYYNHPPGRHNIGADNLNVPESLFGILSSLKAAGYQTGELPENAEALLDLLQEQGVNLPEDGEALRTMTTKVATVSPDQYSTWFSSLPESLQNEMQYGPLGYLHSAFKQAQQLENSETGRQMMRRVISDLKHAVEGADHKGRERVLSLLNQLEAIYETPELTDKVWHSAKEHIDAIVEQQIEGIRGWGAPPGNVMVSGGQLVLPGLQFGNVFIGPQPPRGWELNEELLHANLSFPPPHQYLAFYQWLQKEFKADALVHVGRHSTYEFLPRHRVGMSPEDYPAAIVDDLPSVYPYIVDGVGEGIQAKRRGQAIMVDHLTPPLDSTELYDQLLALRQLIESYEAAPDTAVAMRQRAIAEIRALVAQLHLEDELTASMAGELTVRGLTHFDEVDDTLLVHEVGHYLTGLQESFMPLGLHRFGQAWSAEAVDTMLASMGQQSSLADNVRTQLRASPAAEMSALLAGLSGEFIEPGKGNDPIRTPEVLPTGRNFFALDGSLIPTKLGYQVGVTLAQKANQQEGIAHTDQDADSIVLWASDVVRDEGALIAFGLDRLGIKPVWNSRGIVKGLARVDLNAASNNPDRSPRIRHDIVFTTSGLFRDLYGAQIIWLEQAVLMALDASANTIRSQYPALDYALTTALAPLGDLQQPGDDPLSRNRLAARWVRDAQAALNQGMPVEQAAVQATYRIFGTAPGAYGAGINRLVERSGAWQGRQELASTYLLRMGHVYGRNLQGKAKQSLFKQRLQTVGQTYLGRASNLYGLIDNNDAFDYLGGLNLAVETFSGQIPKGFVLSHADSQNIQVEPLQVALLSELRGRFLNPQWIEPLMQEGYAGARTMGSEFIEYLWGWQVTSPDLIKSWAWDEVKRVYIDDGLELELDTFLSQGQNVHVKSNMLAVMLVAAHKEFWQADQETITQLANEFTDLVLENGLPGSGHTSPSHPMFGWLESYVEPASYQKLQALLTKAQTELAPQPQASVNIASRITEVDINTTEAQKDAKNPQTSQTEDHAITESDALYFGLFAATLLMLWGYWRGSHSGMPKPTSRRD
ncbi:cobaltochelatase subunit CobN [Neptunomonas phycophila]|uniref:Cobaltochelatase subunit CobN n=1 Tax=Neptunomonas phycophila TaxID=1572645 RepID=A0ABT9ETQ1_9GAMM|nr:cobaltochelatase subunit CobN [Neptunomonas phycophila]MDP2522432.1 cobaltochelatase subunit CobN [Neptunomonas phycophila]